MQRIIALAALLGIVACDHAPTAPQPVPTPAFAFENGPAELPHVLRTGGRIISAFLDFENDYAVLANAPDEPSSDVVCGGSAIRDFIPVQMVGDFDAVVKQLALLGDINVHVYQPIPPTLVTALCATEPIAAGTGRYVRTDNDFFGVFGRANAVSEQVRGNVTLQSGGDAHLAAIFKALGRPDGSLLRFETTISLKPVGGG